MKKTFKMIVASLVTIAMCVSVISGATFALFTSESSVSVAVTSGKVSLVATAELTSAYSAEWSAESNEYIDSDKEIVDNSATFTNLGTAKYDSAGNTLALSNITPGDGVKLTIALKNYSTVATKYRVLVSATEDNGLMDGLEFTYMLDGEEVVFNGKLNRYTDWTNLAAAADPENGDAIADLVIGIELPITADNKYNSAEESKSAAVSVSVFAVQQNGEVADPAEPPIAVDPDATGAVQPDSLDAVLDSVEAGSTLAVKGDVDMVDKSVHLDKNVTVDFGNNTVTAEDDNALLLVGQYAEEEVNVTLEQAKFVSHNMHGVAKIENDAEVTFNDCEFVSEMDENKEHSLLEAPKDGVYRNVKLHFDHCKFTNGYLNILNTTDLELTFTDCEFVWDSELPGGKATSLGSSPSLTKFVNINSTGVKGNVNIVLNNCTFDYNYWATEPRTPPIAFFSASNVYFPSSSQKLTISLSDIKVTGKGDFNKVYAPVLFNFGAYFGAPVSEGDNSYTYNGESLDWNTYVRRLNTNYNP